MYMKHASTFVLNLLLWASTWGTSWAQEEGGRMRIGLDLSKNVPALSFLNNYKYFFNRSLLVEAPLYFPLRDVPGLFISVTPGYASIVADPIYRNLAYKNQGFLLKGAMEYFLNRHISVGGGLNAAAYDEFGTFVLPGSFYGDLRVPFRRRIFGVGLEGHYAGWLYLGPRFFVSPEIRLVLHSVSDKKIPDAYYVPGMGATDRDLPITGGVSVRVGYVLPGRR